jgi:hypothetical protein
MIEEAIFDAEEKMEKAVAVARDDLSSIRTGRANPGMFSRIVIDYYGTPTPITQICSINVPEARMVVIKPYEASQLKPIEDSIRNSDLGVNPTNDGNIIRVAIPQLTEERRRELVRHLTALDLPVTGDRGFTHAETTAGGVPLSEIRLESMESRVRPGLHLVGEMLDVDGRIGGFNFQWAWASGFVAGTGVARSCAES